MLTRDVEEISGADEVHSVQLLPSFDCYPVFYSPRDLLISEVHTARFFEQDNGWYHAVLVIDGSATGLWNLKRRGRCVEIKVEPFRTLNSREKRGVQDEAEDIGRFLGITSEVSYTTILPRSPRSLS
jgi:hypothetical protein